MARHRAAAEVAELTSVGIGLEGVRRILRLELQVDALQRRVAELEQDAAAADYALRAHHPPSRPLMQNSNLPAGADAPGGPVGHRVASRHAADRRGTTLMDASKLTTRSAPRPSTPPSSPPRPPATRRSRQLHLLDALLRQPEGIIYLLLQAVGAQPAAVEAGVRTELGRLPAASGTSVGAPSYSRATLAVLTKAGDIAADLKDDFVSTEHLLLGLATGDSPARTLLASAGATADALRGALPPSAAAPG